MPKLLVLKTHSVSKKDIMSLLVGKTIIEVEKDLILYTLLHCQGNKTRAAKMLGISVRTLRNKLIKYKKYYDVIEETQNS